MLALDDARVLLEVLEAGSLSSAARRRGVAQSTLGRALDRLEAHFGLQLVHRSPRVLRATPAGLSLAARLRGLLQQANELESGVGELAEQPRGTLNLSLCEAFAHSRLAPVLASWSRRHPDVVLNVTLDERWLDLPSEGIDLAVRSGQPPVASDSVATPITEHGFRIVAAPAHLRESARPQTPDELTRCRIIGLRTEQRWTHWPFSRAGEQRVITVRPTIEANDVQFVRKLAVAGAGIAALPDYAVADALARGTLISLLDDWSLPRVPIIALHPKRARMTAPARALLLALTAERSDQRARRAPA